MKVLVYLFNYPPQRFAGGELMTAALLEHLVRRGHEVHVYAEKVREQYERNGVLVRNGGYLSSERARHCDIFVTHPEIRTNVWGEVRFLPYVAVVHNINLNTLRSLERQPPDLTVANSYSTARAIPTAAKECGLGVHVIHPPVRYRGTSTPEHFTVVNICEDKGGHLLAHCARMNPQQSFVAVLGGYKKQLTDIQPGNVRMLHQTEDMHMVYATSKALLFPSRSETYGMVVAEAMQHGIPVIASDIPGVREAGGDAATYLNPLDYTAWDFWVNEVRNPDVYRAMSALSTERGNVLRDRATSDLGRWAQLMEGVLDGR